MHQPPSHLTPTSPGVYWCGDVQWIKYSPAIETRILEGHKTQTRLVNIGPVTSIGPKKSSPGDYQVDLDLNVPNPKPVQVSPVGMRRGVLIVPPNTYPVKKKLKPGKEINRVVTTRLRQILRNADLGKITMKNIQTQLEVDLEISLSDRKDFIREEVKKFIKSRAVTSVTSVTLMHNGSNDIKTAECALLALMDSIRNLYFPQVSHFLEEGNKHHKKLGKKPPTFVVRDNLWDLQCAQLRKFLELAKKHGASASDPRVLFGYHGTSAKNAKKIMCQGFSPRCRHSGFSGAFFSGQLEYSANYARDHHEVANKMSHRPTSKPEGPGDILLVVLLLDGNRDGTIFGQRDLRTASETKPVISVEQCIFDERYVMPLARLRGF